MAVKLSKRLQAIADLIPEGAVVADVGCDHGYIPIYLLETKKSSAAIAMDVRRGPLQRAKEHIAAYGMEAYIETRLSDGLKELRPGEADTVVIAGMGGGLMIRILSEGRHVWNSLHRLILQPQSEIDRVRSFLREQGWQIDAEQMVCEEGKYYPMMRVRIRPEDADCREDDSMDACIADLYGPRLLAAAHPVLGAFLKKEEAQLQYVCESLKQTADFGRRQQRLAEIAEKLDRNRRAQEIWGNYVTEEISDHHR